MKSLPFTWSASVQADLDESRDTFISKFSEEPKRDDLTLLCFKDDDPSDQVPIQSLSKNTVETPSWLLISTSHCLKEACMHAC